MDTDNCKHENVRAYEDDNGKVVYLCLDCEEWLDIRTSLLPFDEDEDDDIQ